MQKSFSGPLTKRRFNLKTCGESFSSPTFTPFTIQPQLCAYSPLRCIAALFCRASVLTAVQGLKEAKTSKAFT